MSLTCAECGHLSEGARTVFDTNGNLLCAGCDAKARVAALPSFPSAGPRVNVLITLHKMFAARRSRTLDPFIYGVVGTLLSLSSDQPRPLTVAFFAVPSVAVTTYRFAKEWRAAQFAPDTRMAQPAISLARERWWKKPVTRPMIRSIIVGGLAEAFEKVSEWVQTSIDQSLAEANLSDAIPLVGWALLFAQEAVEHSREDQKEQREERARKDRQREAERDAEDRRFRAALLAAPASEAELSASPGASTSE